MALMAVTVSLYAALLRRKGIGFTKEVKANKNRKLDSAYSSEKL